MPIELRKTNSKISFNNEILSKENVILNEVGNKKFINEHSASSNNEIKYSNDSIVNSFQKTLKYEKSQLNLKDIIKRKILTMLKNENIVVGYTSMTEIYLNEILEEDVNQVKDIINLIYYEYFGNPEILQKITEVMSNLEYKKLHPTNTILAIGMINHTDIGVQEAAIAAFEKWDDKNNLKLLKNINYTADWIEQYAKEVIEYLEGC